MHINIKFGFQKEIKLGLVMRWIGIFAIEENFPINWKIFHFSNFFENSEISFIRAFKCVNFQIEWRRWTLFQFGKIGKYSKIWWIGIFPVEENFSINQKIFHFSNFFENCENLFFQACKCANFQTEWRRWKFFQLKNFPL